jgi:exportin-2 (importin alpha re-exporter)
MQPLTQADAGNVLLVLQNIGCADRNQRTEANEQLKQLKGSVDQQTGLAPLLLFVATSGDQPTVARQVAAVAFRDVLKACWHPQRSEHVIQEGDKELVRGQLFSAMLGSPVEVRRVLASCIELVCEVDFPKQYPGILDEMNDVFQRVDSSALNDPQLCDALEATLSAAHSVFARYRDLHELDEELAQELLTINSTTAGPLVAILQSSAQMAQGAVGASDNNAAAAYMKLFTLTTEVLHDLTTCDLGDEHEKAMSSIVTALVSAIHLNSEALLGTKYRGGPLLELRSSALSLIAMYMERYDDDMQPFAQQLMQTVWDIISAPGSANPASDDLVVSALGFFESSCRGPHRELLSQVLQPLCTDVVLPSLELTEDDIEAFEDDAASYIQRDIEGSDVHTRRHSACKLIRELLAVFGDTCGSTLNECIGMLVSRGTWQARDSAIVLVTAMGLKASSATAMADNEAMAAAGSELTSYVDLAGFYEQHIAPELSTTGSRGSNDGEVATAVLKADALRFVTTFRFHLPAESLAALLAHISEFISAENIVVHSYAAHTIHRILSLPSATPGQLRLGDEQVSQFVPRILEQLCGRLGQDRRLNEYTVKCLAQVLRAAPVSSKPYNGDIVSVLAGVLVEVNKNPSNPLFSHYFFESIGFTLRLASDNPDQCTAIESMLWEPLLTILRDDIVELLPYALQVLALLLDLHPSGSASRSPAAPTSAMPTSSSHIPEHFMGLYQPLCAPALFEVKGNVPAAIRLISSFVRKDPDQLNAAGLTPPTLQLAAKLLMSRLEDHFGFEIVGSFVMHCPRDVLDNQMPTVFRVLFDRMQQRPTPKFARLLALFIASVLARHGAGYFEQLMEGIQPGMTGMVLEQIVLPVVARVSGNLERKACAVGLSNAIQDSQALINHNNGALWAQCVLQCLSLLHLEAERDAESAAMVSADQNATVEELRNAAVEESGIGSKFVQLVSCASTPEDPCGSVSDARSYFKAAIKSVVDHRPQEARSLLQNNLPPEAFATLQQYF